MTTSKETTLLGKNQADDSGTAHLPCCSNEAGHRHTALSRSR